MRALVFAARQDRHHDALRDMRDSPAPAAQVWRPLLDTELLLEAGRTSEARRQLTATDWSRVPPYGLFYQVNQLIELDEVYAALDLLGRNGAALDDDTRVTLLLAAYAHQGAHGPLQRLVNQLLGQKLSLPVIKILSAQLIRYPDQAVLDPLYAHFRAEHVPFNTDTAGAVFSLLCAAGVNADWPKFGELRALVTDHSSSNSAFLSAVEAFFRGRSSATRITAYLPALPLPLEVNYALIARYPGPLVPALSPRTSPKPPVSSGGYRSHGSNESYATYGSAQTPVP